MSAEQSAVFVGDFQCCLMKYTYDRKKIKLDKKTFLDKISKIQPLDEVAMEEARSYQDKLAKPLGSLGDLENIAVQLSGIRGRLHNSVDKTCVAIFSADNGVWEEGVASAPQSVTRMQTMNFLRRLTGVGTLAKHFGADLLVVDMGIKEDIPAELYVKEPLVAVPTDRNFKADGASTDRTLKSDCNFMADRAADDTDMLELRVTNGLVDRKIRRGTSNLAKEPAMSENEAVSALAIGLEMAFAIDKAGYDIFGIGEMGIGNTTTSSAVLSALTGLPAEETVGKGAGIVPQSFAHKKKIVDEVCARYGFSGQADIDVVDVLTKVGGFDIAAMAGAYLGAALCRRPVVIDGYISAVAALAACRLNPLAADYMIASHKSYEAGYMYAMVAMKKKPLLDLGMRLGEGSGCPLAFKIVEAACAIANEMATFEEAAINDDYLDEIKKRKEECF